MMEREQYVPWQEASIGYVCHPLAAYESSPFWTADPKNMPYRDCMKNMTPNGYAGELGYASAAAHRGLHHPQHGRGGGVGIEDAEGSGGAGAEAGGALLQGLTAGVGHLPRGGRPSDRDAATGGLTSCRTAAVARALDNRAVLGVLFMLPAAALLLLFLTYPLGLGTWLGFTDAKIGRAGAVGRPRELPVPVGRRGHAARALQHALLHDRRERHQVRARAVARAAAQQAPAVQGGDPRDRPAAVHRADGAVRDRVLVDLRLAVLDHQLGADAARAHRRLHRLPRRSVECALRRRSPPTSGAACRSSRSRCSPGCRRSRRRTTRRRASTARRRGSSSATSRCRC